MITKDFNLEDVFLISEIIDKMGLEADIKKITDSIQTSKLDGKKDAKALGKEIAVGLGIDIIMKMVKKLHKAKREVINLISSLTGLSQEEVNKFGMKQIKEFFTELFASEGISDFLSQAEDSDMKK